MQVVKHPLLLGKGKKAVLSAGPMDARGDGPRLPQDTGCTSLTCKLRAVASGSQAGTGAPLGEGAQQGTQSLSSPVGVQLSVFQPP